MAHRCTVEMHEDVTPVGACACSDEAEPRADTRGPRRARSMREASTRLHLPQARGADRAVGGLRRDWARAHPGGTAGLVTGPTSQGDE